MIEGHVSLDDYRRRRPLRRPHRLLQLGRAVPGLHRHAPSPCGTNPIYLSTFTGRPPDEPSVLGEALNEVFIPLLQQQFPEIVDFWLPPEGCSYRIAVVSMKKAYPGHAKRVMMACGRYLRQFMYTKWVIVVDDDIDARDWKDVMWAISTRMDPARDITVIENTPIDYLDFASPGVRPRLQDRPRRHQQMAAARPSANGAARSAWTRPWSTRSTRCGASSACRAAARRSGADQRLHPGPGPSPRPAFVQRAASVSAAAAGAAADRHLVEAERLQLLQALDAALGRADDGEAVDEVVGQGAGLAGIAPGVGASCRSWCAASRALSRSWPTPGRWPCRASPRSARRS